MNLLRNKKGQASSSGEDDGQTYVVSSKVYYFAIMLVILVLALTAFVLISRGYMSSLVAVPNVLVHDLVIARVTNVCFVANDTNTNQKIQNTIDLNSFTDEQLENCFVGKSSPRVVLKLRSLDDSFDYVEVFSSKGGLSQVDERYLLVKTNDGKFHPGILRIEQAK